MISFKKVVPLAMALVFAASCGDDKNGDGGNRPPASLTITEFNTILESSDRSEHVGRTVDLNDVPVDQVIGKYVFWAGTARSGMPVLRKDQIEGPEQAHVKKGDKVRINGTVRLVDAVEATDPMWEKISEAERSDIKNAKVFIAADRVRIIQ